MSESPKNLSKIAESDLGNYRVLMDRVRNRDNSDKEQEGIIHSIKAFTDLEQHAIRGGKTEYAARMAERRNEAAANLGALMLEQSWRETEIQSKHAISAEYYKQNKDELHEVALLDAHMHGVAINVEQPIQVGQRIEDHTQQPEGQQPQ